MAVINCGECGATVSTEAKICPGCGASRKAFRRAAGSKKPMSWPKKIGIAFAAVFGIAFVAAVAGEESKDQSTQGETPQQQKADEDRAATAMVAAKALKESLRNPDSLAFVFSFSISLTVSGLSLDAPIRASCVSSRVHEDVVSWRYLMYINITSTGFSDNILQS